MEFVFSVNEGLVQNRVDGGNVMLHVGDAWWADDPFVLSRPEMFSATPPRVNSTRGRLSPEATLLGAGAPVEAPQRGRRKLS